MGAVIKVENLSKQYRLGDVGTGSLKDDFKRFRYRLMGKEDPFLQVGEVNDRTKKSSSDYVWALRDINFEIEQGDVVGIIGRNGAGKSTLLKILSRTTAPTTGSVKVKGRIASLLEVGTGFHGELSGRENIYLNGAIMGLRKWEIEKKLDEIIDFAGVDRYLDTPVKRYSSGMYVRLAFAVAAHLEPDILIVDEVLAVGDTEFQKKCLGKIKDVSVGQGRTVLFVSHNMGMLEKLCKTGILMNNGLLNNIGNINELIKQHNLHVTKSTEGEINNSELNDVSKLYIKKISILNVDNVATNLFSTNEKIKVKFSLKKIAIDLKAYILVTILDQNLEALFSKEIFIKDENNYLNINSNFLVRGKYSLRIIIYNPGITQYEIHEDICSFEIFDSGTEFSHLDQFNYGKVFANATWQGS
jgi:lipopolysaccharide transport system ATP-binding protein